MTSCYLNLHFCVVFTLCLLLRVTTMGVARHRVNLLYITAGKTSHCILLKDMHRLISRQNNNHNNKNISDNIVFMTKPVKSYWKKYLERCKLNEAQRIKLPEADNKKECNKVKSEKPNTNFVYLLSSMQISKVFYVSETHMNHRHQNPSSPNTSIKYHVGAASAWNAVVSNTLNQPK